MGNRIFTFLFSFLFFSVCCLGLKAQPSFSDVQADSLDICVGTDVDVNGQMFICPVWAQVLEVISSTEGEEVDFYGSVMPQETTRYTLRYIGKDKDTLEKVSLITVHQHPYFEVSAEVEPGTVCHGTEVSFQIDSVANVDGKLRWGLDISESMVSDTQFSTVLTQTCHVVVRGANRYCPVKEQKFYYEVIPLLDSIPPHIYFTNEFFGSALGCRFALPRWQDLKPVVHDPQVEILDARLRWADGTVGEKKLESSYSSLPIDAEWTVRKTNPCDTLELTFQQDFYIYVDAGECRMTTTHTDYWWLGPDTMQIQPCETDIHYFMASADTSLMRNLRVKSLDIHPLWKEMEWDSLVRIDEQGNETLEVSFVASDHKAYSLANPSSHVDFVVEYDQVCRYSQDTPVIVRKFLNTTAMGWDTARLALTYAFCDRFAADLSISPLLSELEILDIDFHGFPLDSLIEHQGFPTFTPVSYTTQHPVRMDANYPFYDSLHLSIDIRRSKEGCVFRDTMEYIKYLGTWACCNPESYFYVNDNGSDYGVTCQGAGNTIEYSVCNDSVACDSVRVIYSDFEFESRVKEKNRDRVLLEYQPYLPEGMDRMDGRVLVAGWAHDITRGTLLCDTFEHHITIKACPPSFSASINPDCEYVCMSCPGSEMEFYAHFPNPSTDRKKVDIWWVKEPGEVKEESWHGQEPLWWESRRYVYDSCHIQLAATYNEGSRIFTIDSVPLPFDAFRKDPACTPRLQPSDTAVCGGDYVSLDIYADFSEYILRRVEWGECSSPVLPRGTGQEDYLYFENSAGQDIRPRLTYYTHAQAPGVYPYKVIYQVNDTLLEYTDTLRISVIHNPKVFLFDTMYVCRGSDIDLNQYINWDVIDYLVDVSEDDLKLTNVQVDRIFPVQGRMKYRCGGGNEIFQEAYIMVETDVYLDFDKDVKYVCPDQEVELHASTNGRVTWIKQKWVGGVLQLADTLCQDSRYPNISDYLKADSVLYTVLTRNSCPIPPFIEASVKVIAKEKPLIDFSDTASCFPLSVGPQVHLSGQPVQSGSEGWYDEQMQAVFPPFMPGVDTLKYYYQVMGLNGCRGLDSVLIFNHRLPVLSLLLPYPQHSEVCLQEGNVYPFAMQGADLYQWEIPGEVPSPFTDDTLSLAFTQDADVVVWGRDLRTGCDNVDTLYIRLYPDLPHLSDTTLCFQSVYQLKPEVGPDVESFWLRGASLSDPAVLDLNGVKESDSGIYSLALKRDFCYDTARFRLSLYPVPGYQILGCDSVCQNSSWEISFHHNASELGYQVSHIYWFSPDLVKLEGAGRNDSILHLDSLQPVHAGLYQAELGYGNCTLRDSLLLDVIPLVRTSLPADTFLCVGRPLSLSASDTLGEGLSFRWSTGSEYLDATISEPGNYWVEVIHRGCPLRSTFWVEGRVVPYAGIPSDTLVCRGEDFVLEISDTMDSYLWKNLLTGKEMGYSAVVSFAEADTLVSLTYGLRQCLNADTLAVERYFCGRIYFPSAFTPNHDGVNDLFGPITMAWPTDVMYELRIFNSLGICVFESRNLGESWDGTYKGKDCPAGMYVYRCNARALRDGRDLSSSGNVHLVR